MSNSDERREVAARLREAWPEAGGMEEVWEVLDPILGTHDGPDVYKAWEQTFNRLADLIEPQQIDEDTSDGYHTFRQLYFQRMMLFAVLVAEHRNLAWKTRCHEDGEPCFGGGWFLVTIETPDGHYGYHYEDKYWYIFDCKEIPKAKHWDGYDESDVGRLMSLLSERKDNEH